MALDGPGFSVQDAASFRLHQGADGDNDDAKDENGVQEEMDCDAQKNSASDAMEDSHYRHRDHPEEVGDTLEDNETRLECRVDSASTCLLAHDRDEPDDRVEGQRAASAGTPVEGNDAGEGNDGVVEERGSGGGDASSGDEVAEMGGDGGDTWESLFNEQGDPLDESQMKELVTAVGNVSVQKPQFDYAEYVPKVSEKTRPT